MNLSKYTVVNGSRQIRFWMPCWSMIPPSNDAKHIWGNVRGTRVVRNSLTCKSKYTEPHQRYREELSTLQAGSILDALMEDVPSKICGGEGWQVYQDNLFLEIACLRPSESTFSTLCTCISCVFPKNPCAAPNALYHRLYEGSLSCALHSWYLLYISLLMIL